MSQEIIEVNSEGQALAPYVECREFSAVEVKARVDKIISITQKVMQKDVHYGKIPGTPKPTLYKPGSEILLVAFRIATDPIVEDLSTPDEIRYRVKCKGTSQLTGEFLGSGIGECSSNEEKYKWRSPVCDEEFNSTPEDRRRIKWKKGEKGKAYNVKQVRVNPADVANTILKMAKKRAQIDFSLTVTGASQVFTQDIEDLPEEIQENIAKGEPKGAEPAPPPPQAKTSNNNDGQFITEAQGRRFYAIYKGAGITDEQAQKYLSAKYGIEHSREIKRSDYEAICAWAEGGGR